MRVIYPKLVGRGLNKGLDSSFTIVRWEGRGWVWVNSTAMCREDGNKNSRKRNGYAGFLGAQTCTAITFVSFDYEK